MAIRALGCSSGMVLIAYRRMLVSAKRMTIVCFFSAQTISGTKELDSSHDILLQPSAPFEIGLPTP